MTTEQMTDTNINQQIHKILGLCWHEWSGGPRWECVKCGVYLFTVSQSVPPDDNPDYCSSLDLTARAEAKVIEMVGREKYGQCLIREIGGQAYHIGHCFDKFYDEFITDIATASPLTRCLALIAAVGGSE